MPKLAIIQGIQTGKTFDIGDREVSVIGRGMTADVVIADASVSRSHARIINAGTDFVIEDMGSANGTWVDGQCVKHHVLHDGVEIRVGNNVALQYRDDDAYQITGPDGSTVALVEEKATTGTPTDTEASQKSETHAGHEPWVATEADSAKLRERLDSLLQLGESIVDVRDFDALLDAVTAHLFKLFSQTQRVLLFLRGRRTGRLTLRALRQRGREGPQRVTISRSVLREAIRLGEPVLIQDASADPRFAQAESLKAMRITSAMCAPLTRGDRVIGLLHLDTTERQALFDCHDLHTLVTIAAGMALAVENVWAAQEKEHVYLGNVMSLARAMESKDEYTRGHSERVAEYAVAIATQWNKLAERARCVDLEKLRFAGYLHDIGKIGVSDAILNKARNLTEDELAHIRAHAGRTAYIIEGMYLSDQMKDLDRIASLHHERYDGQGYPKGLAAEGIPVEARILAVADAYDAMTSHRPYRPAMDAAEAVARLRQARGSQLDPRMVDIFLSLHDDGVVEEIDMSFRGTVTIQRIKDEQRTPQS